MGGAVHTWGVMPTLPSHPTDAAAAVRARAAALRRLAALIERADVARLVRLAGDDTWIGATAQACRDDLATSMRRLDRAADDLRREAVVLDHRADVLAATAAMVART